MAKPTPDKLIPVSLMAIDAAGHSKVVLGLAKKKAHEVFGELEERVAGEVESRGGRLLGWAGDGGIAVFSGEDHRDDEKRARMALISAETIAEWMPTFNAQQLDTDHKIGVRIALHSGQLVWSKRQGSIHSSDVNFVAHLEHALPVGTIAASRELVNCLPTPDRAHFVDAGEFEEHHILLFGRTAEKRDQSLRTFTSKQKLKTVADACRTLGLEHIGFRRADTSPLPPRTLYENARSDILMVGVSLAITFQPASNNPALEALRAASQRGIKIHLAILDPASIGKEFANGIHGIRTTIKRLVDEVSSGRLHPDRTFLRKLRVWPHFTGIMIDGDVELRRADLATLISAGHHPVVRIQATIPPESAQAQHYAPLLQFGSSASDSQAIDAYIRGFRHYWHTAKAHSLR